MFCSLLIHNGTSQQQGNSPHREGEGGKQCHHVGLQHVSVVGKQGDTKDSEGANHIDKKAMGKAVEKV